jgi:hypothetical protein
MKFQDCPISTNTYIGTTNVNIDLEKVFLNIPLIDYTYAPKKRGRAEPINPNISNGIVSVKYNQNTRGVFHTQATRLSKSFRNTLTIIIYMNGRLLNFKIFSGNSTKPNKTQHPGVKKLDDAIQSLSFFWNCIKDDESLYTIIDGKKFPTVILYSVMTNINFNIGYKINRQKLYNIIKRDSMFKTYIDIDNGHTGVNIKLPIVQSDVDLYIPLVNLEDSTITSISKEQYYSLLTPIQIEKDKAVKLSTFIVFHSGKIIMSCCNIQYMESHFDLFVKFMLDNVENIKDNSIF